MMPVILGQISPNPFCLFFFLNEKFLLVVTFSNKVDLSFPNWSYDQQQKTNKKSHVGHCLIYLFVYLFI